MNESIEKAIDQLENRLQKNKKIIAASRILSKSDQQVAEKILTLDSVIKRCAQSGNYKRAGKYILICNKLIDRLEEKKNIISDIITSLILGD